MPETEEIINSFQDILYIDKDYKIDCSNKLVYNSLFQTDNTYSDYFDIKANSPKFYQMNTKPIFIVIGNYSDYSLKKIPLLERKIADNMYKYVFEKDDS